MNEHDIVYFNNCKGRHYVDIYGDDAFYDLAETGPQRKQARDLTVGQECVVASYADGGRILFEWFSLTEERNMPDEHGQPCRVLFGDLLSEETKTKSAAAKSRRYGAFFNVNGHFKRSSVVRGEVADRNRPRKTTKKTTYVAEEVDPADGPFAEGALRRITVNAIERNGRARTACIKEQGTKCCICRFDFGKVFGPEAKGYIHVHHVKPLAEIEGPYEIDPQEDLRPVCPNCHAMLHLKGVHRSIDEVKSMRSSAGRKR